jgi:uncharacterized protein with HEPN domain
MNNAARKRLYDAREACRLIATFTAGHSINDYEADPMMSAAVERKFEIIGEALRLAEADDPSLAEAIPDLRQIIGMRNRIIHGYDAVDSETIWNVITVHLPRLAAQLDAALA